MYATQHVRYDRVGDKVTPVRVRKEWVAGPHPKGYDGRKHSKSMEGPRKFMSVRSTAVGFPAPEPTPEPWRSTPVPEPTTRESLLAAGLIRELGAGEKFLPMGTPAEWSNAVANAVDVAWEAP